MAYTMFDGQKTHQTSDGLRHWFSTFLTPRLPIVHNNIQDPSTNKNEFKHLMISLKHCSSPAVDLNTVPMHTYSYNLKRVI